MKRYLIITEFEYFFQKDTLTEEDIETSNSGFINIIDIKEGKIHDGQDQWKDIEVYEDRIIKEE